MLRTRVSNSNNKNNNNNNNITRYCIPTWYLVRYTHPRKTPGPKLTRVKTAVSLRTRARDNVSTTTSTTIYLISPCIDNNNNTAKLHQPRS